MIKPDLSTEEKRIEDFFKFIYKRQKIWYDRFVLKKPYPWTDDPVLKNYKFCNVYRELDKGTIYVIENALNVLGDCPNALFNDVVYRIFNTPTFFEDIGGLLNYKSFCSVSRLIVEKKLDNILKSGRTVFNDAYMICGHRVDKNYRPGDKHVQVLLMLQDLALEIDNIYLEIKGAREPEDIMKALQKIRFIGPFLAYEIWCDISYIDMHDWGDNDYVNIGPGAKWGIELISGEKYKDIHDYEDYCVRLTDEQSAYFDEFDIPFSEVAYLDCFWNGDGIRGQPRVNFLSIRNIEHSLCEYRKYYNLAYLNKGKRRKYVFKRSL